MDNWRRFRLGGSSNGNGAPTKDSTTDTLASDDDLKSKQYAFDEALWGLENFGNTCYCNSILQALYASPPFRVFVESYPDVLKAYNALGGAVATAPIPCPSPEANKPNPMDNVTVTSPTKEKRGGFLGLGKKSDSPAQPAKPVLPAQPAPPPIVLPPDPNFPEFTLFSTIQTLFHHMSSSPPHHPAAPKTPATANGQTNATGNNAASLPSASLMGNSGTAQPGQPQGPSLLASLPAPSTPRGGGAYSAGTLGRGVVRPEDVLRTVRRHHMLFAGQGQQDAHEFLGFFLNQLAEEVERLDAMLKEKGREVTETKPGRSFIQNLFEGVLVNETRCLNCETTSSREECFLDLSIDIEQHSSLTACLRQFSHSEMLCSTNKFYCETCCGLVEAERRMRIKSLPNILGLHLKRFRQDEMGRLHKLFYRVTFPLQLRVPCTTDDTEDAERLYELFAVVVHIGNGPTHGHYVTIVRSGTKWVMCDDENVEPIEESDLANYFGDNITGAGYVLFYQAADLDLLNLGLKKLPEPRVIPPAPGMDGTLPSLEVVEEDEALVLSSSSASYDEKPPSAVVYPPPMPAVAASKSAPAVGKPRATSPSKPRSPSTVQPQTPTGTKGKMLALLSAAPHSPSPSSPTAASPVKSPAQSAFVESATPSSSGTGTPSGSVGRSAGAVSVVTSSLREGSSTRRETSSPHRDASTTKANRLSTFGREPSSSRSPSTEKPKWYSLKRRESSANTSLSANGSTTSYGSHGSVGSAATSPSTFTPLKGEDAPTRGALQRQGTATTLNTVSTSVSAHTTQTAQTAPDILQAHHSGSHHSGSGGVQSHSPDSHDLSSSMISTASGSSFPSAPSVGGSGSANASARASLAVPIPGAGAGGGSQSHGHIKMPTNGNGNGHGMSDASPSPPRTRRSISMSHKDRMSMSHLQAEPRQHPDRSASGTAMNGYSGGTNIGRKLSSTFKMGWGRKKGDE